MILYLISICYYHTDKSQSTNLKKKNLWNVERPPVQNVDLGLLLVKDVKYFHTWGLDETHIWFCSWRR